MFILATLIYVYMGYNSEWRVFWPIEKLIKGSLAEKAVVVIWGLLFLGGVGLEK